MQIIPIKLKRSKAYLIKDDKNILIDAGNPGDAALIMYDIQLNLEEGETVDYVIVTHAHSDHYGSINEIKERTGAKVIIHENDYETMKKGMNFKLIPFSFLGKVLNLFIGKKDTEHPQGVKPCEADIVISSEEFDLKPYGVHGKVIHTPGHTPGSVSIFLENKTAIIGDLNMSLIIPEKPERPMWAYDPQVWKSSIKKVLDFEPKRIEVTHGNYYILSDYKRFCESQFRKLENKIKGV